MAYELFLTWCIFSRSATGPLQPVGSDFLDFRCSVHVTVRVIQPWASRVTCDGCLGSCLFCRQNSEWHPGKEDFPQGQALPMFSQALFQLPSCLLVHSWSMRVIVQPETQEWRKRCWPFLLTPHYLQGAREEICLYFPAMVSAKAKRIHLLEWRAKLFTKHGWSLRLRVGLGQVWARLLFSQLAFRIAWSQHRK